MKWKWFTFPNESRTRCFLSACSSSVPWRFLEIDNLLDSFFFKKNGFYRKWCPSSSLIRVCRYRCLSGLRNSSVCPWRHWPALWRRPRTSRGSSGWRRALSTSYVSSIFHLGENIVFNIRQKLCGGRDGVLTFYRQFKNFLHNKILW